MLQIQPLTEDMQDDVVRRRFHGTSLLESSQVKDAMAAFKKQARSSPSLQEMGSNPLLLALLIGVFLRGDQQLPERTRACATRNRSCRTMREQRRGQRQQVLVIWF